MRITSTPLRLAATLGVSALAGCVQLPTLPPQEAGCQVRQDADLALRRARALFLLPAALDGRQVQMVLDTGSTVSTVTPSLAGALALPRDDAHGRTLVGVGGTVHTGMAVVQSFALGDIPAGPQRLSLGAGDLMKGAEPPVAGLLGADLLAGRDIDLDGPDGRVGLYTIASCTRFSPWPAAAGVAMTTGAGGLQFVVGVVDGHAVRAVVDTGALDSFMTRRLAASLGVTPAMLDADPVTTRFGVSREGIAVRRHRFARVTLGPAVWSDVEIGVADLRLPGSDLLLGADLLGRQRVWISPYRGMLWLH